MRIAFRTDSSLQIGTGHLMRCLTLADELARRDHRSLFVCRDLPGNMAGLVLQSGHGLALLPTHTVARVETEIAPVHADWLGVPWDVDAGKTAEVLKAQGGPVDWLVVDHYALDARWEEFLEGHYARLMVIDDLADRPHRCDLLLDQNLYSDLERRYLGLIPKRSRTLLGPHYALLRPEFAEARRSIRDRDGGVRRVLVLFGGVDAGNDTLKALEALALAGESGIKIDVVIGGANPHREVLSSYCEDRPGLRLHVQTKRVAELMAAADLAIGGGGVATWERCALGLPALVVALAYNQQAIAEAAETAEVVRYLGRHSQVTGERIASELRGLLAEPQWLKAMAENAYCLVDGAGCGRVADAMEGVK